MERKLAEIKVEKKKILINIAIRSIWFIIVAFAYIINQSANKKAEIAITIILILLLGFALFPLIHLKDVLVYYENKIVLKNKQITFNNPSEIQWRRVKTYFTGTRIKINNSTVQESFLKFMFCSNDIDVTYMKDAKDTFIRCYLNQ